MPGSSRWFRCDVAPGDGTVVDSQASQQSGVGSYPPQVRRKSGIVVPGSVVGIPSLLHFGR